MTFTSHALPPERLSALAETLFEVILCLSAKPDFMDSIGDNRASVADDLMDLALATEDVAQADGIAWGETHDYLTFTETLAEVFAQHSATSGTVKSPAEAQALVRRALAGPHVAL